MLLVAEVENMANELEGERARAGGLEAQVAALTAAKMELSDEAASLAEEVELLRRKVRFSVFGLFLFFWLFLFAFAIKPLPRLAVCVLPV